MNASDWAGLFVAFCTITVAYVSSIRWLVKHYLVELKENGGGSIKDTVTRLEEKVEILYEMMLHKD
jgi:transcriptional regulator CtsR